MTEQQQQQMIEWRVAYRNLLLNSNGKESLLLYGIGIIINIKIHIEMRSTECIAIPIKIPKKKLSPEKCQIYGYEWIKKNTIFQMSGKFPISIYSNYLAGFDWMQDNSLNKSDDDDEA